MPLTHHENIKKSHRLHCYKLLPQRVGKSLYSMGNLIMNNQSEEIWKDIHTTKVFEENSTIKEIDDWIKSIDKNASFSNAKISLCVE